MRQELRDLKMHIYEDGEIDEAEVRLLVGVFAASGIGEEEARLLFDLNTMVSGHTVPESFEQLFIAGISAFAIDADGIVTAERWAWLKDNLFKDDAVDALERRLLRAIAARATSVPEELSAQLG
ncbi:MAG: hypothetical protein HY985_06975 [Magnetospirillum sp.]|nr:hypothetical protein [Magnetospirillum sp.]